MSERSATHATCLEPSIEVIPSVGVGAAQLLHALRLNRADGSQRMKHRLANWRVSSKGVQCVFDALMGAGENAEMAQ